MPPVVPDPSQLSSEPVPLPPPLVEGGGVEPNTKAFLSKINIALGVLAVFLIVCVGVLYASPALRMALGSVWPTGLFSDRIQQVEIPEVSFSWVPLTGAAGSPYIASGTSSITFKEGVLERRVVEADVATFLVLSHTGTSSLMYGDYAKDSKNVYYKGKVVAGADPTTFEVLAYKNYVGDYIYAKDGTHAYYGEKNIAGADAATFEALYLVESEGYGEYYDEGSSATYAKDAHYVYSSATVESSLDPSTVSLEGKFLRDEDSILGGNNDIDPASFVSLGGDYYKDKDNYYCWAYTVLRVKDPRTFVPLEGPFAKDSQAVYSTNGCTSLARSDPNTFEIIPGHEGAYAKDANNVYVAGTIGQGIDPDTFVVISEHYVRDASHIYFKSYDSVLPLTDVQPDTFRTFDSDSLYAADATKVFFGGEVLEGALASSFASLNEYYAKDAKQVYYSGSVIEKADPATFVASSTEVFAARDKNYSYLYGNSVASNGPSLIVLEYISKSRAAGYSDGAIRDALARDGWGDKAIDEAFAATPGSSSGASSVLIKYIAEMRAAGVSDDVTRDDLIRVGWEFSEVNRAFEAVSAGGM